MFSNDGTWCEHIIFITSTAWTNIKVMRKLKYKLEWKALEIIYFTFIRSTLEYSGIIWDNCTQYEQNEIEKAVVSYDPYPTLFHLFLILNDPFFMEHENAYSTYICVIVITV